MQALVPVTSLWLPIVLSAVLVFVVSSVIHMALSYHRNDFHVLPDQDGVLEVLQKFKVPPGDYMIPRAESLAGMKSPEFLAKLNRGPVFIATFLKPGPFNMGPSLLKWFAYCVVVGLFSGYVAGLSLGPGTPYLAVFRTVGTVAFAGYALALWQDSIWYKKAVTTTLKNTFDGLVYALITAGTFGWLWP